MEIQKKCSYKKHGDINAISYCLECKVYLCNKCSNYHSELLENHHNYNLDKNVNEIFTGICMESKHKNELEFYCKNHNTLCCAACISKIKIKGNGQHTDCNVCIIEDIRDEKKNKLAENIKNLENLSEKIQNSINELKKLFQKINESKEEVKMKIAKIFTKIRNTINEREDQILSEVDTIYNKLFFKEELIKKGEKLPLQIIVSLEKGKKLKEEWKNDNSNLISKINDCINIEKNIKNIIQINENIDKCNLEEIYIKFMPESDDELNSFLEKIKKFGELCRTNYEFHFRPGNNYYVSNNGLVATKNNGGNNFNCIIIGDKEIPKNTISKWKIKLNSEIKGNYKDIYIGIGPNNPKIQNFYYQDCWSFICSHSILKLKSPNDSSYNNHSGKLKKGDIIEVIVDRRLGNLFFSVNNVNYGLACSGIPKEEILYPIIIIYEQNHSIEIINK